MSAILTNFYDKVRSTVNVSDVVRNVVSLHKKGAEFTGLCPFHSEKTPSFTVNDKKRFYHCFGCGAHGDIIKFESEQNGLSYKDAAYKIADKFSIERPKFTKEQEKEQQLSDRILSLMAQTSSFYVSNMNNQITEILTFRGVSTDVITKYNIGYTGSRGSLIEYFNKKSVRLDELEACGLVAKNDDGKYYEVFRDRIMIPIFSSFGKVIAFGGRSLGQEMPKYLNSPETIIFKKGECLYGEDVATGAAYKSGRIIVVEGYFDVISMHQVGFPETVASLGTAVTSNHLQKMWKVAGEIIICLDGDDAGIRASKKVIDTSIGLIGAHNKISFAILPKGLDPDEAAKKHGQALLSKVIKDRMSLSEYIFYSQTLGNSFKTPEEKSELERKLSETASLITDEYLRKNVSQYFKQSCWELFSNRSKKVGLSPSKELSIKTSSELENIEDVIVCFLIMSFESFDKSRLETILIDIQEKNNSLRGLIECVLDIICTNGNLTKAALTENLKKTSFYKDFEILSDRCWNSIPMTLDTLSSDDVLEFLLAKRHLICLTNEFSIVMQSDEENMEDRLKFYLNEIRITKEKIDKFNTEVTINNR